jgi:hypothetical protein
MSITVYWSPWIDPKNYAKQFLSYNEPIKVLDDLKKSKNSENKVDNFFNCPAFVNSVKNTYMFTSPTDADVEFHDGKVYTNFKDRYYDPNTTVFKYPSLDGANTLRYYANYIFFCEEELFIHSTPPYLHNAEVTKHGYYVPGTFDISSWFRPLEYAFQQWPGVNTFKTTQDDPLLYVNFLTDQPIKLQKFYMTEALNEASISCIRLKNYRREKNLFKLYDIFKASNLKTRLLKEIKNNLL